MTTRPRTSAPQDAPQPPLFSLGLAVVAARAGAAGRGTAAAWPAPLVMLRLGGAPTHGQPQPLPTPPLTWALPAWLHWSASAPATPDAAVPPPAATNAAPSRVPPQTPAPVASAWGPSLVELPAPTPSRVPIAASTPQPRPAPATGAVHPAAEPAPPPAPVGYRVPLQPARTPPSDDPVATTWQAGPPSLTPPPASYLPPSVAATGAPGDGVPTTGYRVPAQPSLTPPPASYLPPSVAATGAPGDGAPPVLAVPATPQIMPPRLGTAAGGGVGVVQLEEIAASTVHAETARLTRVIAEQVRAEVLVRDVPAAVRQALLTDDALTAALAAQLDAYHARDRFRRGLR